MLKRHGMKFVYENGLPVTESSIERFIGTKLADYEPPYYVAPESLPLLEPMEGDLMLCPGEDGDPDIGLFVKDAADIGICTEIIQRNGTAFFMPESEE